MVSKYEASVIRQLAIFADTNGINKSEISRLSSCSPKTVRRIIRKLKEGKANVK